MTLRAILLVLLLSTSTVFAVSKAKIQELVEKDLSNLPVHYNLPMFFYHDSDSSFPANTAKAFQTPLNRIVVTRPFNSISIGNNFADDFFDVLGYLQGFEPGYESEMWVVHFTADDERWTCSLNFRGHFADTRESYERKDLQYGNCSQRKITSRSKRRVKNGTRVAKSADSTPSSYSRRSRARNY